MEKFRLHADFNVLLFYYADLWNTLFCSGVSSYTMSSEQIGRKLKMVYLLVPVSMSKS